MTNEQSFFIFIARVIEPQQIVNSLKSLKCKKYEIKGHSLCKQCLHDLQFMKKGLHSPNLSKLARADISCQFMKTRSCAELFTQ